MYSSLTEIGLLGDFSSGPAGQGLLLFSGDSSSLPAVEAQQDLALPSEEEGYMKKFMLVSRSNNSIIPTAGKTLRSETVWYFFFLCFIISAMTKTKITPETGNC